MKIIRAMLAVCAALFISAVGAGSDEPPHTKILPHSVDYPLISPQPFPSAKRDPYRWSFNVRRVFTSVYGRDYENTLIELLSRHQLYGGYGVLGHGEDVFTSRAAQFRRQHQGRP